MRVSDAHYTLIPLKVLQAQSTSYSVSGKSSGTVLRDVQITMYMMHVQETWNSLGLTYIIGEVFILLIS